MPTNYEILVEREDAEFVANNWPPVKLILFESPDREEAVKVFESMKQQRPNLVVCLSETFTPEGHYYDNKKPWGMGKDVIIEHEPGEDSDE